MKTGLTRNNPQCRNSPVHIPIIARICKMENVSPITVFIVDFEQKRNGNIAMIRRLHVAHFNKIMIRKLHGAHFNKILLF